MSEPEYRRLSPLTPVVRSFVFVVAVVAASWRDLLRGDPGPLSLLLLGLVAAGAVYGTASWLRTKYWIAEDELRVDTGVLSRQSRRIRIDRLQGIDIVQPLAARVFGLAELRMDVAGGSSREGSLAFLPLDEARRLRDQLLARRDEARAEAGGSGEAVAGPAAPAERPIARLDLGMLLVSLLLSPETVWLLVTLAALGVVAAAAGQPAAVPALLPVAGGFGLVLLKRLVAHYRFTVSETPAGVQVRRGLLELNAQTIARHRIQGVVITEPLLWRRLGWARLDVSIAGYGEGGRDEEAASTVLPVGDRALVGALAGYLLGGRDPAEVRLSAPPDRARWVSPVGRRFQRAGLGEHLVVSRDGWLMRRTHVVPHARVQSIRLHQGPWQRRFGLADLLVDSPPGPVRVRVRHRFASEARALLEAESAAGRAARGALDGPPF